MTKTMLRLSSFILLLASSSAFVVPSSRIMTVACSSAPTADESAQALTDYMAKAHEEKIRAMADVEAKFQTKIKELEKRIAELDGSVPIQSGETSFSMPATNKAMSQKVDEYRTFISAYVVKSSIQRAEAVADAVKKTKEKYEAIIVELSKPEAVEVLSEME